MELLAPKHNGEVWNSLATGTPLAAKYRNGDGLYESRSAAMCPIRAVNPPIPKLGLQTPKRSGMIGVSAGARNGSMGGRGGMGGGRRGEWHASRGYGSSPRLKIWTTLALAPPPRERRSSHSLAAAGVRTASKERAGVAEFLCTTRGARGATIRPEVPACTHRIADAPGIIPPQPRTRAADW